MNFRKMTLEELQAFEEDLLEKEDDYALHVSFYEELHRRISALARKNSEAYGPELEYIERFLIDYLIKYGAYLKMVYQKDDYSAEKSLKKALRYDRKNPIAHYRLGFLAYKGRNYTEACTYFQKAMNYDPLYPLKAYRLNTKQCYYAYLYLTNSALHIADSSYKELEQMPAEVRITPLPNLEISPFYEYLSQNEQDIKENAFYKITEKERTTCSKEKCEELVDEPAFNIIFLYFHDRGIDLIFNEKAVSLSPQSAEKLRYLLLKSSIDKPATRASLRATFNNTGEVLENTFIQAIKRLKDKLEQCGVSNIIETIHYRGETAYYFNGAYPFTIMYRTDDLFELNE